MSALILQFAMVLIRVAGFLAFAPVLGGRQTPRLVKVGLALSLAWLWLADTTVHAEIARLAAGMDRGEVSTLSLALVAARETMLGAAMGYLMGLFLLPGRIAGLYLGHEAGLSMANIVDPNSNMSGNVLAELLDVLGAMLFFALDAHHVLLQGLHAALVVWPVGSQLPRISSDAVADRLSQVQQTGFLAAMPTAACLFVATCGLMVLMRTAPQFNLFSIGQSLRVGVGLLALLLFLPHTMAVMIRSLAQLQAAWGH